MGDGCRIKAKRLLKAERTVQATLAHTVRLQVPGHLIQTPQLVVAWAVVDNSPFNKAPPPSRGHMYSSGDTSRFPTVLCARFHCSSAAATVRTRFIVGALQRLGCWITCWACSDAAVASCCCMTAVLLLWPGGSVLLRGAGGSLLEGAGGQGCRSQLGGAVCRHRGGHWAMLPARGPFSPHELPCPGGASPPANTQPRTLLSCWSHRFHVGVQPRRPEEQRITHFT